MIEDENFLDEPMSPEPNQYKKIPLVYSWGKNEDGELGIPGSTSHYPTPPRGFKGYAREIATARSHSVILN